MKKGKYILFILMFMVSQIMASNMVRTDSLPNDSLHAAIWKSDSLQEVVVKGSSIIQSGDKMKVAITKDLRRGTVSAVQMLGRLPDFVYNFADRSLTYHNSTNIVVLVDSVEKDMSYLQNIQHMRFDRVEIIDKPQGQYQGYDVLINLHTKNNYEGYEGNLSNNEALNFNKANDKHFIFENTVASFSYTKNKWNIYASAYSYFGQTATDSWWSKQYPLNGIKEETADNLDGTRNLVGFERIQTGQLSIDYAIDKLQSLSFVYQYNAGRDHDNYFNYSIWRTNENEGTRSLVNRKTQTHSRNSEHSMALFYRNNHGKIKWTTDFNYRYTPSRYKDNQEESTGFSLANHFRDKMNFTRFRLSGWTNLDNGHITLNSGYENIWKSYKRNDSENDKLLNENSYLRNRFWAAINYRFDNNAQLMLSGWVEHICLTNGDETKRQVPVGGNFMAFYQLSRKNWMRLNYDCSTAYPDQALSSEYGYFTDSLNWSGGNPWLKTSVTHRINYWIDLWWCFNFQCGYVYSPNSFNSIAKIRQGVLPNGGKGMYVANIYQNTVYKEWWASVSFTKRFCRDFLYKADLKYRNARASYQDFSNHVQSFEGWTSLSYYLQKWDMNMRMAYSYSQNFVISPQSTTKINYEEPAISVQKYLLKKRLEIGLTYSLMFHLFNGDVTSKVQSPAIVNETMDKYFDRQRNRFAISVVYRFAGGKSVRQYNRDMSSEK